MSRASKNLMYNYDGIIHNLQSFALKFVTSPTYPPFFNNAGVNIRASPNLKPMKNDSPPEWRARHLWYLRAAEESGKIRYGENTPPKTRWNPKNWVCKSIPRSVQVQLSVSFLGKYQTTSTYLIFSIWFKDSFPSSRLWQVIFSWFNCICFSWRKPWLQFHR